MTKSPTYNKAAVDKELTKAGVKKPKAKALTHKLLKGHQKTNESGAFNQDIVNFSMFAGMYSDGAHAVFRSGMGQTSKLAATGDRPRKYYIDGVETPWEEVKRIVGTQKVIPRRGMEPYKDESVQEDGASDAERNPSIERDKYRNRNAGPSAADREKLQIDRDRKSGMNMDPMDILKRRKERAMWGESVAVTTGDTDAWTNGHVAGKKGKGTNPYEKGSKDAKEWDRGRAHATSGTPATRKKKVKESKNLTEGVLDDMDDDGFMAKRQLYDIAKYAVALHKMIQDTDNLEPWIQAKITKAQDYIDTVKHYLEYNDVRDADATADVMGPPDMGDIDDVGAQLDTMMPTEEIMEFGDEDEGSVVRGEDVLRWAVNRGIISDEQNRNPTPELISAADNIADWIGTVTEIGSSEVSIWLREFVNVAKGSGALLDGPKAHLYESQIKAQAIYSKMLKELRKK